MDIDARRFGQGLQRRVLSRFRYLDGVNLTPIKSLLVIAVPRPAHVISLETPCGGACMERCPTGAITGDRFPIDAESCLSRLNECPGIWPDWLPPEAHNCLWGCLACQENCPQNAGLLSYEDTGVRLDVVETAAILARSEAEATASLDPNEGSPANGSPDEEAWQAAVSKLGATGLDHCRAVLGRNLRALLGLEVAVCGPTRARLPNDGVNG